MAFFSSEQWHSFCEKLKTFEQRRSFLLRRHWMMKFCPVFVVFRGVLHHVSVWIAIAYHNRACKCQPTTSMLPAGHTDDQSGTNSAGTNQNVERNRRSNQIKIIQGYSVSWCEIGVWVRWSLFFSHVNRESELHCCKAGAALNKF